MLGSFGSAVWRRRDVSCGLLNTSLLIVAAVSGATGCGPTMPSCTDQEGRGETQLNTLRVQCSTVGSRLECRSVASITGLYVYCPKSEDVTSSATWTAGDPGIVRVVTPGVFEAVRAGDTFIRAQWQTIDAPARPVSVFDGAAPLPTFEIFGSVYEAGRTVATGALNGALIEILDGLVAGRSSTSGVPPPLLPGYLGPFGGPGYYRLIGVPPGTYHLRVSKDGFITQERFVTVTGDGSPVAEFALQPA